MIGYLLASDRARRGEKIMEQVSIKRRRLKDGNKLRWITVTAVFMALTIAFSSFGIPVPGGHLYLCDVIICTAAILLDPLAAFAVGGIGSFLGDMLFYPAPMFVSLVTHGLQAVVISLMVSKVEKGENKKFFMATLTATLVGAAIMVTGYTFGRAYIYGREAGLAGSMVKLPYEIAHGLLGVGGSLLLCFKSGLLKIFRRMEMN